MKICKAEMLWLVVLFIITIILVGWQEAIATPLTVTREYTYRASEADSKITCRAIALEQVKRLLLEELGTYLVSNTEVKNSALTKDEIVTYTAGTVATVVIKEGWNGEEYYLMAKISADANEVAKAIASMHEDHEKSVELEQLRDQSNDSLKEIERLRQELAKARSSARQGNTVQVVTAQKDYNQAVARLTAKEYVEQGLLLRKSGKLEESVKVFGKAIECAPSWFRPYVTRGATFNLMNKPRKALADLDHALQLNPKDMIAVSHRGFALLKVGRRDEGMSELERAISAAPKNYIANSNMGWALLQSNMPGEALIFLTKSINLHPNDNARAYFLRSQAFKRLGKKRKAQDDLTIAARQGDPKAREFMK